jgi:hypothetical protein
MIENELKVQTIIYHMYVKENDITIEQLQKLKQIVEGLDEIVKSDSCYGKYYEIYNFGFKEGQEHIINKLNTEL